MPQITATDIATASAAMRSAQLRFTAEVQAWTRNKPREAVTLLHSKLAQQALRGVVFRTPVDTGRARANWTVGRGEVPEHTRAVGGDAGPPLSPRAAAAVSVGSGRPVIATIKKQPYTATHITNNVEYIEVLEAGGSRRQPDGMVAVTVHSLTAQFGGQAVS